MLEQLRLRLQVNDELHAKVFPSVLAKLKSVSRADKWQKKATHPAFLQRLSSVYQQHADLILIEDILDHVSDLRFEILRGFGAPPEKDCLQTNMVYAIHRHLIPEHLLERLDQRINDGHAWFHKLEIAYNFDTKGNSIRRPLALMTGSESGKYVFEQINKYWNIMSNVIELGRNFQLVEKITWLCGNLKETLYSVINASTTVISGIKYTDGEDTVMDASNSIIHGTAMVDGDGLRPGEALGYKYVRAHSENRADQNAVATLIIPADAKYTSGSYGVFSKIRTDRVIVKDIRVFRKSGNVTYLCESIPVAHSVHDLNFMYVRGQEAIVENFNSGLSVVCGAGIHFFWCLEAATSYFEKPETRENIPTVRDRSFYCNTFDVYTTNERAAMRVAACIMSLVGLPAEMIYHIIHLAFDI
jgi:hypothetical protein